MRFSNGTVIDHCDPHHKYADAFTEFLSELHMNGGADEASGDVIAPTGWFARLGRHILYEDDHGFVSRERFNSIDAAKRHYVSLENEFFEWDDGTEI